MRIAISRSALAAIRAHVRAEPGIEVCGLLFGNGAIERAEPTPNVAADPRAWFEIDPAALIAAHKAARAGGPVIIGHYHSHPNGSPTPSARDAAASQPGQLWLIAAGDDVAAWRAGEGTFRPVALDPR